jgi:hypothetical protein
MSWVLGAEISMRMALVNSMRTERDAGSRAIRFGGAMNPIPDLGACELCGLPELCERCGGKKTQPIRVQFNLAGRSDLSTKQCPSRAVLDTPPTITVQDCESETCSRRQFAPLVTHTG